MKGMVLRALVYQMISEKMAIEKVVEQAEAAVQSFMRARQLDPDDEHGYISEVQLPPTQPPREETIHRAKRQLTAFSACACPFHMIQYPLELCPAEVGIRHQARLLQDDLVKAFCLQLITELGSAAVLPHNRGVNWLSRCAIPYDGGLALVGDANCRHVLRLNLLRL
jgi:hypothetical protein